jgi:hypothetical protein
VYVYPLTINLQMIYPIQMNVLTPFDVDKPAVHDNNMRDDSVRDVVSPHETLTVAVY